MLQSPLLLLAQGALSFIPLRMLPSLRRSRLQHHPSPLSHPRYIRRGLLLFLLLASQHPPGRNPLNAHSQFRQSLSAAFTQTRLLRPEYVSAEILMLTYLSTLRSKSRRFLFRSQNAYFANSPNTSTSPPLTLRRVQGWQRHNHLLITLCKR